MKASLIDQLTQLAADYRAKADAIHMTLAILRGEAIVAKKARAATVLAHAITIDTQRINGTHAPKLLSNGHGPAPTPPRAREKGSRAHDGTIAIRRQQTADFLDLFSTTEPGRPDHPRAHKNGGISRLVSGGYLRKAGDGYVRTKKPFTVMPWRQPKSAPRGSVTNAAIQHRRAKTDRVLAKFTSTEPRQVSGVNGHVLMNLVRYGYLTEVPEQGYLRTAKPFSLTKM